MGSAGWFNKYQSSRDGRTAVAHGSIYPSDKGSRKKTHFISGPTTKALNPTPLELSGHIFFGFFFSSFGLYTTRINMRTLNLGWS